MEKLKGVVSVGESSQSMETKGICILLVNEDLICHKIVSEMLQHCNYQVLQIGGVLDVLNAISEKRDNLELVLTNSHKLESNGIIIIQYIHNYFNLPITLMSPDKMKIVLQGQPCSFTAYVLNGLSRFAVNNLWQFALEKEKGKMVTTNVEGIAQRALVINNNVDETKKTTTSLIPEGKYMNSKRKEPMENKEDDSPTTKKSRVVWTAEMHQKFVEAINVIGYEKAVPKKIVEVMNIPGITRENVASHLQKFRGGLKRAQELALTSVSKTNEYQPGSILSPNFTQGSSSIARAKESSDSWFSRYLKTRKPFSYNSTSLGGCQFLDLARVNKFNQKFQLNGNFRIYGDDKKDMLLSINQGSSSRSSFVGYRLANNGNSIQFGLNEALVTPGTSKNKFTSFDKQGLISNQDNSKEHALLVSPPGETSFNRDPAQCIPVKFPGNENIETSLTKEISVQNLSGNDAGLQDSTENCWDVLLQEVDGNFGKTLSNDQDLTLPLLELDAYVQDLEALFDGISEENCSSPSQPLVFQELNEFIDKERNADALLNETVGTCSGFDWEEVGDTFFGL